ncbi:mechanosensitive ion channel family protein [Roseovarius spongiae]|uniref:Small-conductance mechanosensitive channel n=1 Tax=Roseovarius spongiae TaxID=2320272 RepID=A0A3A8ATJ1_9RHOB|nr:mechanosensitive ion channel domain-containing protein [Roseovarius spongiae]RKF13991.1 mechanosensitive ion channel family protein [Roseovarius spongiae]
MEEYLEKAISFGPLIVQAIKALIVLVVGWMAAGLIGRFVRRQVNKHPRIDNTLGNFAATLVTWIVRLMVLMAVLGLFGIEATSLVAVMGAATLAIGMALQGTLADLAAGIMLVIFQPYKNGQYVDIGGTGGTVVDITLFYTELKTPDNVQIIVPNGQAWGSVITNYSVHDTRRLDLTFGIDYDDDSDAAMKIILDAARADDRIHADPEPWARVTNLGDSSVDITARLWCATADYWELKFKLTKEIKEAFDAKGISIPYPHQVNVEKDA